MTAFQPELPELPAVRVCRDRFAVQGKNRRVEQIGNADCLLYTSDAADE